MVFALGFVAIGELRQARLEQASQVENIVQLGQERARWLEFILFCTPVGPDEYEVVFVACEGDVVFSEGFIPVRFAVVLLGESIGQGGVGGVFLAGFDIGQEFGGQPPVGIDEDRVLVTSRACVEVGDDDDGEFEPLGFVDRHQSHDVVVLARDARLLIAQGGEDLLAHQFDKFREGHLSCRAAGFLHEQPDIAHLAAPGGLGEKRRLVACLRQESFKNLIDAHRIFFARELCQKTLDPHQGGELGGVESLAELGGIQAGQIGWRVRFREVGEGVVVEPDHWAAEKAYRGDVVVGGVDGSEGIEQVVDFLLLE